MKNFEKQTYFIKIISLTYISFLFFGWFQSGAIAAPQATGVIALAKPDTVWLRWTLPVDTAYYKFPQKGFTVLRSEKNLNGDWSSWELKRTIYLSKQKNELKRLVREEFENLSVTENMTDTLWCLIDAYINNKAIECSGNGLKFDNTLDILLMLSLDRRIAKILGLFWEDLDVERTKYYQYKVIGNYSKKVNKEYTTGDGITVQFDAEVSYQYIYEPCEPVQPFKEIPLVRMNRIPYPRLYTRDVNISGISRSNIYGLLEPVSLSASQPAVALWWRVDFPHYTNELPFIMYNIYRKNVKNNDDWFGPINAYPVVIPTVPTGTQKTSITTENTRESQLLNIGNWFVPDFYHLDRPKDDKGNIVYGKYDYAITGIDIFGRESEKSGKEMIDFIDFIPPPPPEKITAVVDLLLPNSEAKIDISWKWGKKVCEQAPDARTFLVFRKTGSPDLSRNLPIYEDNDWEMIKYFDLMPNDSLYFLADTVGIGEGDSLVYYFYRVVTGDNWNPSNLSKPSAYVFGYAVDNEPPDSWQPIYDPDRTRSPDWKGMAHVYLYWEKPEEDLTEDKSLDGFNLYRAIDVDLLDSEGNIDYQNSEGDTAYQLINRRIIKENFFIDQIEAIASNKFFYKIKAVDKAGNLGDFSAPSYPVVLPDVTPPSAPIITKAVGGDGFIKIKWTPCLDDSIKGYIAFKAISIDNAEMEVYVDTISVAAIMGTVCDSLLDLDVVPNTPYYYRIVAVDTAYNRSAPSLPVGSRSYDATSPNPPEIIDAVWNTEDEHIELYINLPEDGLRLAIWRKTGDSGSWFMISPLSETIITSNTTYTDGTNVDPSFTYFYKAQVYDLGGNKSEFSIPPMEIGPPE